ncbi:hypothetical protein JHK87_006329 [Glycine soja]|nr:hypothetical protein JHK87_006329 [Glycine soja]
MQLQQVEKSRNSLEVFGSPILSSRSKSLSFDKKLAKTSSSSWDVAPKIEETDFSAISGGNYNDVDSDASSNFNVASTPLEIKLSANCAARPVTNIEARGGRIDT